MKLPSSALGAVVQCLYFALIVLLPISLTAYSKQTEKPVLRLVANMWEPFTGENLDSKGIASKKVTSILSNIGYDAQLEIMPWARAYKQVSGGEVDGIVAIWYTVKRAQVIEYSDAYLRNRIVFIKRKDNPFDFKGIPSLSNKVIAVGRDYDYTDDFTAAINFTKVPVTTLTQSLDMLILNRIDIAVSDEQVARYYMRNSDNVDIYTKQLDFAETELGFLPLHFGVSKQHPNSDEIIDAFNRQLSLLDTQ